MKYSLRSVLLFSAAVSIGCGSNPAANSSGDDKISTSGKDGGGEEPKDPGFNLGGGGSDGGNPPGPDGGSVQAVCGDSVVEDDEECDDGNARPGDGCSGLCLEEPGYDCPAPGQPCTVSASCGNAVIEGSESCDDGNNDMGDGCDDCRVEAGWACDASGCREVVTSVCGDAMVGVGEQCDDGQDPPADDDGCDATCQVENGWVCRTPGEPCTPLDAEFCGNGAVEGDEACDDENGIVGDGCSASCEVEVGFVCENGKDCHVECGDELVVGDEACDDGNLDGDDGCSADCSSVEAGFVCPIAAGVGGDCVEQPDGPVCPNGILDFGEGCDDGNSVDGDGCTNCNTDSGYRCPIAGKRCEALPRCGDGFVDVAIGEQCDDGDTIASNGCNATCQVGAGFVCPTPVVSGNKLAGGDCRPIVCGDGTREGAEECDDAETPPDNGDGCTSACKLENGWVCPLNASCQARDCGDGIAAGLEECDHGSDNGTGAAVQGVICSDACLVESDPAECGDGGSDPGEACDDGNNNLGDGCGVFCEFEPTCVPPNPCTSACGDGIKFGSEACDDGNTRNGDGCSSTCQEEPGFYCTEEVGDTLRLPVVYRDFKAFENGGHVAFQWTSNDPIDRTPEQDIWVRTTLGTAQDTMADGTSLLGKPVFKWYAECDGSGCADITPLGGVSQPVGTLAATECNAVKNDGTGTRYITADDRNVHFCGYGAQDFNTFSQWYLDDSEVNTTIVSTLELDRQPGGEFVFDDNSFFPLDGLGFGNEDWNHNYHFTSEVRYWFEYDASANATLTFDGDDDVWVFVNGQLVVDISGTHGEITDSVTLGAGTVDIDGTPLNLLDGEVYEIVVFQAERNTSQSNYRLTLQNFTIARSECQSVCGDGIKSSNEQCDYGDTCDDGSTCGAGTCDDGSPCNDGSYGGCTPGPDRTTGCKLAGYCGDGTPNGPEDCDDGRNTALYSDGPMSRCASGCVWAPYCGDDTLNVGFEQCDGSADCEADCTLEPQCGDGTKDPGEQCDEGAQNGTVASACDVQCRIKCGNGGVDAGEQCDPGQGNFSTSYGGCLPKVGTQPGCVFGPRCGDGIKNGPEQCDDGANDGSYGTCAPGCVLGPRCGDGMVQSVAGEVCDTGTAAVSYSYKANGAGECTRTCRPVGYCGDGAVTNGEGCDDGTNSGQPGSCDPQCEGWVVLNTCGNGKLDSGEECDDGTENGTAASNCDGNCRVRCGNGVKDAAFGEECDDGVNDGRYGTCEEDCSLAGYCGDGEVDGPEQCDDGEGNQADPYGPGKCTIACVVGPYCGDGRIQTSQGEDCDGQAGCTASCRWSVPR